MKKIILLIFTSLLIANGYSQCSISGLSSLSVGSSATFSIPNLGQCGQCYDWDISGKLSLSTSDKNNSITVSANSTGSASVQVTYFNESGCHTCNYNVNITGASSCCEPVLESYFICNGWPSGHGAVYIDYPNCDRNSVSSIDWVVNGAKFNSGPLTGQSSGTTYGPGSPGNIGSASCQTIYIQATVHYNNGCSTDLVTQTLRSISKKIISAYPNPASDEVKIDISSIKDKENAQIRLVDITSGEVIHQEKLDNNTKQELTVGNLKGHSMIKILIIKDQKIIEQQTLNIK